MGPIPIVSEIQPLENPDVRLQGAAFRFFPATRIPKTHLSDFKGFENPLLPIL
jgi:hypothetical protein